MDSAYQPGDGFIESFQRRYPTHTLEMLLADRTTGRNIIWADNEYEDLGDGYLAEDEITLAKITSKNADLIKPRVAKEAERQSLRTKSRAEVFTPSWLCNQMNNDIDEAWFGRREVFTVGQAEGWQSNDEPISFPEKKNLGWRSYVKSRRLEITCGEAPFVCSRYDTVTGQKLPVAQRIGFLDRKLRVVSEQTSTRKEWVKWALEALKATYGFEFQGDNLLIARINVLETFCEHLRDSWVSGPNQEELEKACWIISWNFWQMDGLTDAIPTMQLDPMIQSALFEYAEPMPKDTQPSLFEAFEDADEDETTNLESTEEIADAIPRCVIYDWHDDEPLEFATLKGEAFPMAKKFYAAIGNPPYQEQVDNGNKTYAPPIYHCFMDAAFSVAEKVELITPARFLFNAGSTPKAWNKKMLNDPHFKVLHHEADSAKVFPNTDVKGGVAISYRDAKENFGPIEVFTHFDELRTIKEKVNRYGYESLSEIIYSSDSYHFTDSMHEDHPEIRYSDDGQGILSKGHDYDLKTNVLANLDGIVFFANKPDDGKNYIGIYGRVGKKRTQKSIRAEYIEPHPNLEKWKVFVPKANGSGALGEVLSTPLIGHPLIGHTQSFISIGAFDSETEANALLKYIKTKFSRTMLGILKITQDNPASKWRFVPMQDFTSSSDIDWSKSVAEIDQQLYAKYGLDEAEIDFIETNVKEMV